MSRLRFLWLILLIPGWMIQYMMIVPLVWLWLLFLKAVHIGLFAILLFFIPVVGWIILLLLAVGSTPTQRQKVSHGYLRPWGASLLRGNHG